MISNAAAAMDRMIDQVDRLHSSPAIASQVLQLLQDEDFDMHDLVSCLEMDPALAAAVLRLVNSSYFGLTRSVSSLQQAVAFLGVRSLRLAVLGFGLVSQLTTGVAAEVLQDYWRRSLTMAAASSRLAIRRCRIRGDEAWSVGLLSDIGVLVLAQTHTDAYTRLYHRVGHTPLLVESERELYGFDHGQLGGRLLARWKMPDELVAAVECHCTEVADGDDLQLMCSTADLLADVLWSPNSPCVMDARQLLDSQFGIDLDEFITLALDCKNIVEEMAATFNVQLGGTIDCTRLLADAQRMYQDSALESALDWDSLQAVAEFKPPSA